MSGGGGDRVPPPSQHANGGEFLLQLLRRPSHQTPTPPQQTLAPPSTKSLPAQNLSHDPAVAALGPTFPFTPFSSNGHDLPWRPSPPHPPLAPHNYFARGFPQNLSPNPTHNWSPSPSPPPSEFNPNHHHNLQYNRQVLADEFRKQGFFDSKSRPDSAHQHERNLTFGSMPCEIRNSNGVTDGTAYGSGAVAGASDGLLPKKKEISQGNRRLNGLDVSFQNSSQNQGANSYASRNREQERRSSGGGPWGKKDQQIVNYRAGVASPDARPPPGFANKPSNLGNWESGNRSFGNNVDRGKGSYGELSHGVVTSKDVDEQERRFLPGQRKVYGNAMAQRSLSSQLDHPGPSAGSNLHSVSASDIEESLLALHSEVGEKGEKQGHRLQDNTRRGRGGGGIEFDGLDEHLLGSPSLEDGSDDKKESKPHRSSRDKDYRSDTRGQRLLAQRMRFSKRHIECRSDIHRLNAPFVAIYESLIPPEEEKVKQKQLLTSLEKLVSKEWPGARLYLYGSCANSFGVSKSDIDVCLAFEDPDVNKSEALLKLADMLQSDNFQNVQALTRARVPIVKLMEPVNGISCDICINNVLAVVNTKLLRDYSQIDVRLRQLAFIVKHWAKSRGVNVTYQGTLSSYAYVLMCIHFLQQRKPAILPCLQGMGRTYAVTVDNVECAYYDQVEKLSGFGSRNMESIAQLVWAFFSYWAYCHDYANDVISIRTGSLLSKRGKDWTRRIGNDRHLICIEDPFEISHDLGRVVDRYSIRVLREEFERAAEIMQYDPDPCVTLFEPYVPG